MIDDVFKILSSADITNGTFLYIKKGIENAVSGKQLKYLCN